MIPFAHDDLLRGIVLGLNESNSEEPFFSEAEHLPIRIVPTHEFTIENESSVWMVRLLACFLVADVVRKWGIPLARASKFLDESKVEDRIVVSHLLAHDVFVKEHLPSARKKVLALGQDEGLAIFRRKDMKKLEKLPTWDRFVRLLDESDEHTLMVPCAGYVALLPLPKTRGTYAFSCKAARFERLTPEQILLKYSKETYGLDVGLSFECEEALMDLIGRANAQA